MWLSGYHEIIDGDIYTEIWMYNNATADMFGGDVFQLGALDFSIFDMYGGTMDRLLVRNSSLINIHGGDLDHLVIYDENGLVNLYAYDVAYHPTGGGEGWMDGKYLINDQYFTFDVHEADISHINIVPEPTTLLFLALGILGIRRRN
ncbi:MAG: PEP-CTERM sorting domain-containing protein [Planctomycetota bacterium]